MARPAVAAAVATALFALGCPKREAAPAPPPFQIFVKVESEPGRGVPGAVVTRDGRTLGTTGADGRTLLVLNGAEGEITDVTVKCPEALKSPSKPVRMRLTRLADPTKVPEYAVACPPALRHVVVAVKADNGPNLPVLYLDRAITRTDASGAAHFALEVAPGAEFRVTLDTQEAPRLRPVNPSKPFTVGPRDDILLFEQAFTDERKGGAAARR